MWNLVNNSALTSSKNRSMQKKNIEKRFDTLKTTSKNLGNRLVAKEIPKLEN